MLHSPHHVTKTTIGYIICARCSDVDAIIIMLLQCASLSLHNVQDTH